MAWPAAGHHFQPRFGQVWFISSGNGSVEFVWTLSGWYLVHSEWDDNVEVWFVCDLNVRCAVRHLRASGDVLEADQISHTYTHPHLAIWVSTRLIMRVIRERVDRNWTISWLYWTQRVKLSYFILFWNLYFKWTRFVRNVLPKRWFFVEAPNTWSFHNHYDGSLNSPFVYVETTHTQSSAAIQSAVSNQKFRISSGRPTYIIFFFSSLSLLSCPPRGPGRHDDDHYHCAARI